LCPPHRTSTGSPPPTPTSSAGRLPFRHRAPRRHLVSSPAASSAPPLMCLQEAPTTPPAPVLASMRDGMDLSTVPRPLRNRVTRCPPLRPFASRVGLASGSANGEGKTGRERQILQKIHIQALLQRPDLSIHAAPHRPALLSIQLYPPRPRSSARLRGVASGAWLVTTVLVTAGTPSAASSASAPAISRAVVAPPATRLSTPALLPNQADAVLLRAPAGSGLIVPPSTANPFATTSCRHVALCCVKGDPGGGPCAPSI
jgi:hypothetical protein